MRSLGDTQRLPKNFLGDRMAKLLYSFTSRDEAHRKLVRVSEGSDSLAECREDPNEHEPYQVWSGPDR